MGWFDDGGKAKRQKQQALYAEKRTTKEIKNQRLALWQVYEPMIKQTLTDIAKVWIGRKWWGGMEGFRSWSYAFDWYVYKGEQKIRPLYIGVYKYPAGKHMLTINTDLRERTSFDDIQFSAHLETDTARNPKDDYAPKIGVFSVTAPTLEQLRQQLAKLYKEGQFPLV